MLLNFVALVSETEAEKCDISPESDSDSEEDEEMIVRMNIECCMITR